MVEKIRLKTVEDSDRVGGGRIQSGIIFIMCHFLIEKKNYALNFSCPVPFQVLKNIVYHFKQNKLQISFESYYSIYAAHRFTRKYGPLK